MESRSRVLWEIFADELSKLKKQRDSSIVSNMEQMSKFNEEDLDKKPRRGLAKAIETLNQAKLESGHTAKFVDEQTAFLKQAIEALIAALK